MDTMKLTVQQRDESGNGPARRLRAEGRLPGVVYGKGVESASISVDLQEFKNVVAHGHNIVLDLDFTGGTPKKGRAVARYAVVKQIQIDPVRRTMLHVDLHEVNLTEELEATVAIELVGTPAGLIDGGVLDWIQREVSVRSLPGNVPSSFALDVGDLAIGHHLTVKALSAAEGVTILDDPETIVVALVPPRVEVSEAGPEEGVEPELVGGQKGEE